MYAYTLRRSDGLTFDDLRDIGLKGEMFIGCFW